MKKRLLKKVFAKTFIVITMVIACVPMSYVKANNEVTASYSDAVSSIVIPRYEADGSKVDQRVSDTLKSYLDTSDLVAQRDSGANTLTLSNLQLKDVYLDSDYLNGKAGAGRSYFNMLNFYTDVKQVKQLLVANPGYSVIDSLGNTVDEAYIDELLGLLDQINDFDPSTNLKYNYGSVFDAQEFAANPKLGGTDVIATSKEGNVSFKFHIDSHGYWGYDLGAHDSITGIVMGYDEAYANENQHDLTVQYANFFVIEMENKGPGKWYMLNNTDLENPMIYVSEDGKEAFMIDVDFYGENVLNRIIKEVIGEDCESLKIFLTHNHGDHVNNLAKIAEDPRLKEITTIIWPENEPHTVLDGVDLVELFDNVTIKDMEKISAAGNEFQFIEILDEHTPGGGQLADLTNKVIYSGDSLGAQVHLGGTTISMSSADNWLAGARKAEAYIQENGIKYNIGGHTPYLNDAQFASWVATAIEYAKEQFAADASWSGGLVVVENGKVVSAERLQEMFVSGVSDREELNIASVNFRNDIEPDENPDIKPDSNPDTTPDGNQGETADKVIPDEKINSIVKTGDQNLLNEFILIGVIALGSGLFFYKKRYNN